MNEPAFEVEEIQPVGGNRDETTTTYIRICASDRRAIRTVEEIGGVCRVCEQVVCAKCADFQCALCGSCVCKHESIRTAKGDVCQNHGFFETLWFLIRKSGSKNTETT